MKQEGFHRNIDIILRKEKDKKMKQNFRILDSKINIIKLGIARQNFETCI